MTNDLKLSTTYSCRIVDIQQETFEVKAININDNDDVLFLTFSFNDVKECDRDLIEIGNIFDYSIVGKITFNKKFYINDDFSEINTDDLFE